MVSGTGNQPQRSTSVSTLEAATADPLPTGLPLAFVDGGLVGFLGGEATGEAAADDVAPVALLPFGEGFDAGECFGVDADAEHPSGAAGHVGERSTDVDNVGQCDTVMV